MVGSGSHRTSDMSKKHYFKAGDLLFRRGRGVIPFIIRLLTLCNVSHIVVCINNTWCLEATHGEKVRVRPIEDFLSDSKHVYYYKQYYGPSINKNLSKEVVEAFVGKGYEDRWKDLLGSAIPLFDDKQEDYRTVFCSELVAYYLQNCGIVEVDRLPDEYTPADFAKDKVGLCEGRYFGKMKKM